MPVAPALQNLIPCDLGAGVRPGACPICCNNHQWGHFSLMLSQGREKLLWSGCARKLKEQGLLFLLSQTCWALLLGMALWEGKTAPQVS